MGPVEILIRGHLTSRGYGRTHHIAARLGVATAEARRILLTLEKRGVVQRDPRSSAVNDICWVLAPVPSSSRSRAASEGTHDGSSQQVPLSAPPQEDGRREVVAAIERLLAEPLQGRTNDVWERGRRTGLRDALFVLVSPSAPPQQGASATAADTDNRIAADYAENRIGKFGLAGRASTREDNSSG